MDSKTMSLESFNKLVKLMSWAFYDDNMIAVMVLDALTRRQWVREEDLAKDLKLHSKQLRRTLQFFQQEKLVTRENRKERAKPEGEGEEKKKVRTHSHCCLDYAQIYDVVRYRLHHMKKKLKDEVGNRNNRVEEYICPNCGKRYTALDALLLVSLDDECFHCENCNGELRLAAARAGGGGGGGDDNASEKLLVKMEKQLKELMEQLTIVKDLSVPEFGSLREWELARGSAANGDPSSSEMKVEVVFCGEGKEEDMTKSETGGTSQSVFPPWMIQQGMNLTKEQRGEDGSSAVAATEEFLVDKKLTVENDYEKKNLQDEYVKAYYAALLKKQQEQQEEAVKNEHELANAPISDALSGTPYNRQVGMKSKGDEDEYEDDVEWKDADI